MLIRALIVLLFALNLGAAAWWITRPAPTPVAPPPQPEGVARLHLLSERKPAAVVATVTPPPAVAPAVPPATDALPGVDAAEAAQCFSLGPFADAANATAAGAKLSSQSTRQRARQVPGKAASGYQVTLPPSPDRATAQALAQRINAAGFEDLLVVASGDQANGIALGRYGSREAAERRQSALQAAGFPAQLQAIGAESPAQWWLDLAANPGVDGLQLKTSAAAAQARSLDCAELR
jgi:SPOR domain